MPAAASRCLPPSIARIATASRDGRGAGAPPVTQWESLGHPIVLARQMWNHAAKMRAAQTQKKIAWQQLTTQDLSDMLV